MAVYLGGGYITGYGSFTSESNFSLASAFF